MNSKKKIQFLTVVFFIGILLSITLYLGVDGLTSSPGSAGESASVGMHGFDHTFYNDDLIDSFVKYCDYKIFRHIDNRNIIIGQSDWLFETTREDNGYDFVLDYVGGCPYSDAQMAQIAHTISLRRQACAERDAQYLLVIVPNSMTAVSEQLPAYMGNQSQNTRLKRLRSYLDERREPSVLDLSAVMATKSGEDVLYNNTEDSINAYGAFFIYDAVMSELSSKEQSMEARRLSVDSIQFFTHYTDGKSVARKAGLEQVISNRTVSLSENMADLYRFSEVTEHCVSTVLEENEANTERLVIECSAEWDKIQLMPYFSNTFETVVYENSIGDGVSALDYHNGTVLIQVIHESELDLLLG